MTVVKLSIPMETKYTKYNPISKYTPISRYIPISKLIRRPTSRLGRLKTSQCQNQEDLVLSSLPKFFGLIGGWVTQGIFSRKFLELFSKY